MSDSFHVITARLLGERLQKLLDLIMCGCTLGDAQRTELIRLVSAIVDLRQQHRVDGRGECRICRPGRRWLRERRPCSVHGVLTFYLMQPEGFVPREIQTNGGPPHDRVRVTLH